MSRPAHLLALWLSLGSALGATPQEGPDPAAAARESHARMVATLAKVGEQAELLNRFLGEGDEPRMRAAIAAADETTPPRELAFHHYRLGLDLLRLARPEEAIASLDRARELLAELPERPKFYANLVYDLAVAHMRLGELTNCVARHTSRSCILPIEGDGVHVDPTGSRNAAKWFREARTLDARGSGHEVSARWLLNIVTMTLGEYPDALAEDERIDFGVFDTEEPFPRFTDVSAELGLDVIDHSGGAIVDDFDGDGLLDVMSSSWHSAGQLRLFKNRGDGSFEERTAAANLTGILGGLNLVQADYDDDGDLDVLVLRGAWLFGPEGKHPNSLLQNQGDGTFLDVTYLAGLAQNDYPTQTGAWADYDLDGDLDLYVGNEAVRFHRYAGQLFQNQGDGSFVDVAKEAGVANLRFAKGVVFGDYDGDRWPDLYVSNLDAPNRLYRNQRDGTFVDVAEELGVTEPTKSFPVWFWDFDNDGHLDLFVSSYDKGENWASYRLTTVAAGYLEDVTGFETPPPRLYRNDGKGGFVDVAAAAGVARPTLPMSGNFGDLDNDGFPDFYLGTGYPYYDGLVPNVMLWNRGGTRFEDVTTAGGFGHLQKGHGIAFADLDQDGDQDVFEQMGGAFPGDAFANALYENPGFGNHWLKVRLTGVESVRSAIGTRIRAVFREDGVERSVYRHVGSGGSFGANPLMQHLGLGRATKVDRLEVWWPKSDTTQVFRDLPADLRVEITEGEGEPRLVEERAFALDR